MRSQLRHARAAQLVDRIFRGVPGARRANRTTVRAGLGIGVRARLLAAADAQTLASVVAFPRSCVALRSCGSAVGAHKQLRAGSCHALRARLSSSSATLRPNSSFKPTPLRGAA